MPTTYAIIQGNKYMDATLWTGNGTGQSIVNAAPFQPDLVWAKNRGTTNYNVLTDSVRGVQNQLYSNTTDVEATGSGGLTAFNSNGFTVGTNANWNNNTYAFVGWQWKANAGSNVTNTTGTITSTVSANTTAGFSIVTYTGTGTTGTVGHGLGVAPSMVIVKARNQTDSWIVYHSGCPNPATNSLILNSTGAVQTSSLNWNSTAPTSSVFSVYNPGSGGYTNGNGYTYVTYCWAAVPGFSAFGSYTGNGSTDGPFVYTGFRPRFLLTKRASTAGAWHIYDTARKTYNVDDVYLQANDSAAEISGDNGIDILSNGFKLRSTNTGTNENGTTIIYAAFAETPFKYANAR
jgi:hypothetical protein